MTPRERYLETILFGNPDKIPLNPGNPRESTLKKWRQQGLDEGADYIYAALDVLGICREAALAFNAVDISFKMIPEFDVKILEHKDNHYIVSDWMGAVTEISDTYDESYLRSAKDFVTRRWHKFPVENREDWEKMKERFDIHTRERVPEDVIKKYKDSKDRDYLLSLNFNGVFWQLREWCGFENLCIMMAEERGFIHEMAGFWADFVAGVLNRVLPYIQPDRIFISEDMAYKAHSMISPAMTREFILPAYNKWIPEIKKAGCPVIELDSDGYIEELIPIWIEAGINCCSPIEVAAHCDIVRFRKKFGKRMSYMQGIDKRLMAKGRNILEKHVMVIVKELYKDGGFIPGCDHGVPPDISWQNYVEFTKLLAGLSGWL